MIAPPIPVDAVLLINELFLIMLLEPPYNAKAPPLSEPVVISFLKVLLKIKTFLAFKIIELPESYAIFLSKTQKETLLLEPAI